MNANARAHVLSQVQRQQYAEQGYLAPFEGLNKVQVTATREFFNERIAELSGRDAYSINCFQARLATLWDLCHAPAILDVVEGVLGPNIVCWATHLFNKEAGDPRSVPWHQDAVFWQFEPRNTCTVWLAIDDADEENSALRFIPGSHRAGHIDWETFEGSEVLDRRAIAPERFGEPITNALKAGQFSIHHDLLLHGSEPNRSSRRRCGLTFRFCTPDVRVTDAEWGRGIEAILVRGQDPSGYWQHHPRPSGDSVVGEYGPRNIGGN